MAANSLNADGTLILNGKTFNKDSFTGSTSTHKGKVSLQSFSIVNHEHRGVYPIIGYNPTWTYKVYVQNMGDIDLVAESDPNYDYEFKDNYFILYQYNWDNGPYNFLIVGTEN